MLFVLYKIKRNLQFQLDGGYGKGKVTCDKRNIEFPNFSQTVKWLLESRKL